MQLTEEQTEKIKALFQSADQERLLFGPDDTESLYFHGIMLGMRETLEALGAEVKGVTGLWWYERKKQLSTDELILKYGTEEDFMIPILKGREDGVRMTLDIAQLPETEVLNHRFQFTPAKRTEEAE